MTDANYNDSSHVIILDTSIDFSFPICYAAEFSPLVINAEEGVPLEHLITCVQGVRVGISRDGFKTVCWSQTRPQESDGGPGKMCLCVSVFLFVRVVFGAGIMKVADPDTNKMQKVYNMSDCQTPNFP